MEQENQNLTPQKKETNIAKNIIIVIIILAIISLVAGLIIKGISSKQNPQNSEQAEQGQQEMMAEKINVLVGQVDSVGTGFFKMKAEAAKNKGMTQDMMIKVLVSDQTDIFIQSIPRTLSSGKKIEKGPGEVSDLQKGDTVTVKNFQENLSGKKEFTASSISVKRIID